MLLWRRQWHPTPLLLPGKSHWQRTLVGCSPWGRQESDMTEWLHFHFSLSRTGEGNGNRLQCSCLENPRVGGAWWAAIYGVTQNCTWLKQRSSSSYSSIVKETISLDGSTSDHFRQTNLGPLTFHDWVDVFKALKPLRRAFSLEHISDVAKENNEQRMGSLEGRPNHLSEWRIRV